MEDCERVTYEHQASDDDYKNKNDYTRGHLFPVSYAFERSDKISTFTLTNIVPQVKSFNSGSWVKMEHCVQCILKTYCSNQEAYVVTGANPSKDTQKNKLNEKINIPSVLWSAFCCHSKDKKTFLAGAHWGKNTADCTSKYLEMRTLKELQQTFGIDVFPKTDCPSTATVAELYPKQIKSQCNCTFQPLTTSAPPAATNQQFIDFLYSSRTFCRICKYQGSVKAEGHQKKKLKDLCLKLKHSGLRSEDIDEASKEFLLKLLKSDF